MTIKQRLALSSVLLIILPVSAFFVIEISLGYLFFIAPGMDINEENMGQFTTVRFVLFVLSVILINTMLILMLARSIISPLDRLSAATKEMGEGNLDVKVETGGRDEISALAREFDEMRRRLKMEKELNETYEEEKRHMIAGIGHDLRTPVTSMKGYVDGLIDGVAKTPEKREKYLKTIAAKADELDTLIDELSLFSRLDEGRAGLLTENIGLDQLLSHIIDEMKLELEESGIELSFENIAGETIIPADRSKLFRVFVNILNNSIKYRMHEKHSIRVQLSTADDHARVIVSDNGKGIGREALSKVFQPFYREDSSRNKNTGGSGLGLSIVKSIIENHDGYIDIESEPERGTEVTVGLPLSGGIK
ncbi:hypothetical protein WN59_08115 [Salinicoccus sediminis]|uniref:histidine kinase n=1 Tax=Salinicoccus sediminis TaxID=1432562 RepID=A0A0M2SHP0_9STAP|nr:HAMP domain-containing sensor histidine kinase [Salinicoccus sediminis]KKK34234.1 hypothetical protein WN59_08115 [Salinicoccus sediminis]